MAMVDVSKMKQIEKQRVTVHSTARATYSVFEDEGKRYFQIDTYGRSARDMPEKNKPDNSAGSAVCNEADFPACRSF